MTDDFDPDDYEFDRPQWARESFSWTGEDHYRDRIPAYDRCEKCDQIQIYRSSFVCSRCGKSSFQPMTSVFFSTSRFCNRLSRFQAPRLGVRIDQIDDDDVSDLQPRLMHPILFPLRGLDVTDQSKARSLLERSISEVDILTVVYSPGEFKTFGLSDRDRLSDLL